MDEISHADDRCPVCGAKGAIVRELPRETLLAALREFVRSDVPPSLLPSDYKLRRCGECSLEFADPMAPAPEEFYEWLDANWHYYLPDRWEWAQVESIIGETHAAGMPATVLEFGGGDGSFLRRVKPLTGQRVAMIERSDEFAEKIRATGIEAFTDGQSITGESFDFVLAFHYLEHVSDPIALLEEMLAFAGEGRVFASVPYSPMSFESTWVDPLNHPPHHLTRWNANSLHALADKIGRRARLYLPPARGVLSRTKDALKVEYLGPHWRESPADNRSLPLKHPLAFFAEWVRQMSRDRVNGRPAADVVLCEFV